MSQMNMQELQKKAANDIRRYYAQPHERYLLLHTDPYTFEALHRESFLFLHIENADTLLKLQAQKVLPIQISHSDDASSIEKKIKKKDIFSIKSFHQPLYGLLYERNNGTENTTLLPVDSKMILRTFIDEFSFCGLWRGADCTARLLFSDGLFREAPIISGEHIFFLFGGYGDFFSYLPILQFLSDKRDFLFIHNDLSKARIVQKILPGSRSLFLGIDLPTFSEYERMYDVLAKRNAVYPNPNFDELGHWDYYEICGKNLGCTGQIKTAYLDFAEAMHMKGIAANKDIELLRSKYRYVVALQRVSSSLMVDNLPAKQWNYQDAVDFIKCCQVQGIGVVNMEKSDDQKLPVALDLGRCEIDECFDSMSAMDGFVGVDSCFASLAGILGIPNITLFGSSADLFMIKAKNFMPVLRNFSYLPVSNALLKPSGEEVCVKLADMLAREEPLMPKPFRCRVEHVDYEIL